MKYTFEDFLMDKHANQYIGTKDCMVDDSADWIANLNIDETIKYADVFQKQINAELLECLEEAIDLLDGATLPEERRKFEQAIAKAKDE